MSTQKYAVTLKQTRRVPTVCSYESYLTFLRSQGYVCTNVNYEETRGLHIHFIVQSEGYPDLKMENHGWHIKCAEVWDLDGWISYSEKDKKESIRAKHIQEELHEMAPYPYDTPRRLVQCNFDGKFERYL